MASNQINKPTDMDAFINQRICCASIFRILNAAGIDLNRGRTRGPHKKADDSNEQE